MAQEGPRVEPSADEPDEVAQLASALRIAVMRLSRRLRSERSDETLGLSQLSALATLSHNGPLSPSALAELERIQPPSMTRVLVGLEERQLVRRAPHPTDRRQAVIEITDAGLEIVLEDRRRRAAWLAKRVTSIGEKDRAKLDEALPILVWLSESE